jgi:hypothetical protein
MAAIIKMRPGQKGTINLLAATAMPSSASDTGTPRRVALVPRHIQFGKIKGHRIEKFIIS